MTMAANLKRLRKRAQFSQEKLAEVSGVSQQLISQIETGKNQDTKKLPELARALGCSVEELDPSYYIVAEGTPQSLLVSRFKTLLETDDAEILRSLDDHLRYLEFRQQGEPGSKSEEGQ